MSPSGPAGRHLLVFDRRRFIYLYILYADFGAAAAAAGGADASAREYSIETFTNDDVLLAL